MAPKDTADQTDSLLHVTRCPIPRINYTLAMLWPLLFALTTTPCAQNHEWKVHDLDRPQPPRIEGATVQTSAAPQGAVVLFDGSSLEHWTHAEQAEPTWTLKDGALIVKAGTGQLISKDVFGDAHIHVEWMVPESEAKDHGQARGNSGVFLMGLYEIQVLESGGSQTYADGMAGALYGQCPPSVNASAGIGQWNSYDIYFRAPRFLEGEISHPAHVTVIHNGHVIHNGRVLQGITRHKVRTQYHKHADRLPLTLQDHGDPVHYRNIWVKPLDDWRAVLAQPTTERLSAHVQFLKQLNPERSADFPGTLDLATLYVTEQMRLAGLQPRLESRIVDGRVQRNVIARLGPKEGAPALIAARFDHQAKESAARDNAIGVAALIELGRDLATKSLATPVELLAYQSAGPPLFDSDDAKPEDPTRDFHRAGSRILGVVCLEHLRLDKQPIEASAGLEEGAVDGPLLLMIAPPFSASSTSPLTWTGHLSLFLQYAHTEIAAGPLAQFIRSTELIAKPVPFFRTLHRDENQLASNNQQPIHFEQAEAIIDLMSQALTSTWRTVEDSK